MMRARWASAILFSIASLLSIVACADDGWSEARLHAQGRNEMAGATIVIAFSATRGMAPFASRIALDIRTAFESLPPDIQRASRIGFVFFRGEEDDERCVIIKPQSIADAVSALASAAKPEYMKGGGKARPVLDAVYIARHHYPWSNDDQAAIGRKLVFLVTDGDVLPTTTGKIYAGVPAGIGAAEMARDQLAAGIPVIAVQAGPHEDPDFSRVMSGLSEGSGGAFISWGTGDDEDRRRRFVGALADRLAVRPKKADLGGRGQMMGSITRRFHREPYGGAPVRPYLDRAKVSIRSEVLVGSTTKGLVVPCPECRCNDSVRDIT